jgi:putative ABC transport system substrate-binding protein
MRKFAKELVMLRSDAILAIGTPAVAALKQESRTVPIVFVRVSDPVGEGFVLNLANPGSNITGFTNFESSMATKWLELLKEIVPHMTRVTAMFDPATAPGGGFYFLHSIEAAAPSFAVEVSTATVHDTAEIERAIAGIARAPGGCLIPTPDVFLVVNRELIIDLTARYRVPAVYQYRYFVTSGGLISYGIDAIDQYRQAAGYIDRILKGERPAGLPVQAPTKYELVINRKTAKALGLTIPQSLLATADEVVG